MRSTFLHGTAHKHQPSHLYIMSECCILHLLCVSTQIHDTCVSSIEWHTQSPEFIALFD